MPRPSAPPDRRRRPRQHPRREPGRLVAAGHAPPDDERFAFLLPQIEIAHQLGARGRAPAHRPGRPSRCSTLLPILHAPASTLFEEIQGSADPRLPQAGAAIDPIVELDDPHVRLLVDICMFMPPLPPSYLDALRGGRVPAEL